MVVVSNTSPLSNLAIVGRLALLRDRFGAVLVPSAVRRELNQLRHGHLSPHPSSDSEMPGRRGNVGLKLKI